ncbi:MAG: CoA transferase [Kordiimonadaceae bacterium]|nr:CoA transferase [Kordiimonadaceae bacterium]
MGPLKGLKVIEIASLAPGPFCAMMLSDMGAEVIRIDRTDDSSDQYPISWDKNLLNRGRKSIALDLKDPKAVAVVLELCKNADAIIEGFRPGVMERLGLGPDVCFAANEALVYGRVTGWGQDGHLAHTAGHDINYISLTGALHAMGPKSMPIAPLNMLGDFAGGGMMLAFGLVCAILESKQSGKGQVVDAAMTDGSALMMTLIHTMFNEGVWKDERESNLVDGGAPHYRAYKTKDEKFISVGAVEPKFFFTLVKTLGLDEDPLFSSPNRPKNCAAMTEKMATVFLGKTRDEWEAVFEGKDACFTPVKTLGEAASERHNRSRNTFVEVAGVTQPAPAPRFSRTPGEISAPPCQIGEHTADVLRAWGIAEEEIAGLLAEGSAVQA